MARVRHPLQDVHVGPFLFLVFPHDYRRIRGFGDRPRSTSTGTSRVVVHCQCTKGVALNMMLTPYPVKTRLFSTRCAERCRTLHRVRYPWLTAKCLGEPIRDAPQVVAISLCYRMRSLTCQAADRKHTNCLKDHPRCMCALFKNGPWYERVLMS